MRESLPLDAPPQPEPDVDARLEQVCAALRSVRLGRWGLMEQEIHERLSWALSEHAIRHLREHVFAPRCRADLWVPVEGGGMVVEVKKRRPELAAVVGQLHRYARAASCQGLVLVLERAVPLRRVIEGKPARVISLNALWGVAT